jgi:hypothetical protein
MPLRSMQPRHGALTCDASRHSSGPARLPRRGFAPTLLVLAVLGPRLRLAHANDSSVEVAVRAALGPLFGAIERHVPSEVRHYAGWRQHNSVQVRYAACRGG